MDKGAQKILDEIEADQKRIAALTEKDLQNAYEEIKKKGLPRRRSAKIWLRHRAQPMGGSPLPNPLPRLG